jgi:hypothetical protein
MARSTSSLLRPASSRATVSRIPLSSERHTHSRRLSGTSPRSSPRSARARSSSSSRVESRIHLAKRLEAGQRLLKVARRLLRPGQRRLEFPPRPVRSNIELRPVNFPVSSPRLIRYAARRLPPSGVVRKRRSSFRVLLLGRCRTPVLCCTYHAGHCELRTQRWRQREASSWLDQELGYSGCLWYVDGLDCPTQTVNQPPDANLVGEWRHVALPDGAAALRSAGASP